MCKLIKFDQVNTHGGFEELLSLPSIGAWQTACTQLRRATEKTYKAQFFKTSK